MAKQSGPKKTYSSDSFIEAFRDLGRNFVDTAKKDFIEPFTPKTKPISGALTSGESVNFPDLLSKEKELEAKYKKQARWQAEIAKKQEQIVYTRQDREVQLQVKALQQEIQQLTKASVELSEEAEMAVFNLPPEAGAYHVNFFERLRNLIKALRSKIQESSYWLAEWNKKAQKRNYYWRQAKKRESSFLLHHDRQVATQTG